MRPPAATAAPTRLLAILAVTAAVTLAGCMAPEEPETNPLFGLCPQWFQGEGQQAGFVQLSTSSPEASATQGPAAADMRINGRAFDMLRLDITDAVVTGSGAAVRLRAHADLNGTLASLNLWDYRPAPPSPSLPVVDFTPGEAGTGIVQVFLTTVTQDQPPRPAPVLLSWSLQGNGTAEIKYTATFHYKVCGASVSGASLA